MKYLFNEAITLKIKPFLQSTPSTFYEFYSDSYSLICCPKEVYHLTPWIWHHLVLFFSWLMVDHTHLFSFKNSVTIPGLLSRIIMQNICPAFRPCLKWLPPCYTTFITDIVLSAITCLLPFLVAHSRFAHFSLGSKQ